MCEKESYGKEVPLPSPLPSTLSRKPGSALLTPSSSHSVSFAVKDIDAVSETCILNHLSHSNKSEGDGILRVTVPCCPETMQK